MRLALALTLTLVPTAAHALYIPPTTMTVVRPQPGEQAVPLNTKLWLDAETATETSIYATPREVRLFAADEPVPLNEPVTIDTPGSQLLVYTPTAPLQPATTYELRNCEALACDHLLASFTTAATTDATPPSQPQVDRVHIAGGQVFFAGDFADDILVIDDPDGPPDSPLITGRMLYAAGTPAQYALSEAEIPGDHRLRFATHDLAGNFSGWTDEIAVEADADEQGCAEPDTGRTAPNTCRTTAPSPWYLLLPLLLRRRKPAP